MFLKIQIIRLDRFLSQLQSPVQKLKCPYGMIRRRAVFHGIVVICDDDEDDADMTLMIVIYDGSVESYTMPVMLGGFDEMTPQHAWICTYIFICVTVEYS